MKTIPNIFNKLHLTDGELDDFMMEEVGILCKGNRLYGLRKKQLEEAYTKEDVLDR